MNKRVLFTVILIILLAAGAASVKLFSSQRALTHPLEGRLRRCAIVIGVKGTGEAARVKMMVPQDTDRQTIYNEHMDHEGFDLEMSTRGGTDNRMATWRASLLDGSRTIQYAFACHLRERRYTLPQELKAVEDPLTNYPHEMQVWLNPSKNIQSSDQNIRRTLRKIAGKSKNISKITAKIFAYVRGEVVYKSERGSKNAADTLAALEADCGGKARLFCALSRAAGIPSRLVGGLIMDTGSKNTTHVWCENFMDGRWIPFDAANN
ncbi:MAG: transglutaminase domain-containing protein, partial [Candidatus Omnitrophica bacterium]|nr:transglutaminase domain-containing protein [Candidatus Omnitrophota bacterium]